MAIWRSWKFPHGKGGPLLRCLLGKPAGISLRQSRHGNTILLTSFHQRASAKMRQ